MLFGMHDLPTRPQAQAPSSASTGSEDPPRDRSFGIAISRAFEVLRCFTADQPLLGNGEIVRRTGLPKATVSRITLTLEELGYLYRLAPLAKYRLGWGVVSLGYPLLTSMTLRQIARPAMQALANELRVNVNMGTFHRLNVVYVETVRYDETSVTRPDIGALRELMDSSMGRALVWSLDDKRRTALLNRLRLAAPDNYEAKKDKLEEARRDLISKGFCISKGETHAGIWAVSVPMRVVSHEEPLAFNCAMSGHQLRKNQLEDEVGPRLVSMVRMLESQLGIR